MRCVFFILVLMLFPGTAVGESFSLPIPGLVGEIDFPRGQGKEVGFDFGQQFSEITSVSIEISAHVFALEFDVCGTLFEPAPCVHKAQLLGLRAQLDDGLDVLAGFAWSDGLSFYDGSSTLEGVGTDVGSFFLFNPSLGWDFLLSGKGDISLFWDSTFGNPDRIIIIVTEPSGEIFSARLIIEATPVPEPSTALLQAVALLTVAGIRQRRKISAFPL